MLSTEQNPDDGLPEPVAARFALGTVYLTNRARYVLQSTGQNARDELRKHLGSPAVEPPAPRRTRLLLPGEDLTVATYPEPNLRTVVWSSVESEPAAIDLTGCKSFDGATIVCG